MLIVPDKFKGTLSAEDVGTAIAQGWKSVRPQDTLRLLPMSDGGDGFGNVIARLVGAKILVIKTINAAHQSIQAEWWWEPSRKAAIIESARVIGLALLPEGKFHPFQLDTSGLARVLNEAVRMGAKSCLLGIGGSATNDGGFGLAHALGWRFLDRKGRELSQWPQLIQLHRVVPPENRLKIRVTVAVDVANPLLGKRGCSRVFGPQKGLKTADIPSAEKCLGRLAHVLKRQLGIDCARVPGAGAAGGLGFGLMAFFGAEPQAGFELFAGASCLEKHIRRADLVITGEGALDTQTVMGKGVGQIGLLCRKLGVPCIALAGVIRTRQTRQLFWKTRALTELTDLATAKKQPGRFLKEVAASLAEEFEFPDNRSFR